MFYPITEMLPVKPPTTPTDIAIWNIKKVFPSALPATAIGEEARTRRTAPL